MTEVRYDGPGHRLLAFGQELRRGESGLFTEAEAQSLQDQPHLRVTVLPGRVHEPEADIGEGQHTIDTQED